MSERINIHPGEIIEQEFMAPVGMTAEFLAFSLGIPIDRVKSLLAGDEPVTAELSAALARAFNTTSEFWLNLQAEHEKRSRRDRL